MRVIRRMCGPFFVVSGALHFIIPTSYRKMVPPSLPAPATLVAASGVAEIAGGIGLTNTPTRRLAGWWLIATLIAVFPANVHMALNPDNYKFPGGARGLWARLPAQLVFIAWVLAAMRGDETSEN